MALFPNPIQDSFDLYAAIADAASGPAPVWGASASWEISTDGRLPGSRALTSGTSSATLLRQATGSDDGAVIVTMALKQNAALLNTNLGLGFQGLHDDGLGNLMAQWTVLFRSDGAVLLKSGGASGTTLATLTGVFTQGTYWQFQIEVVTDPAGGSIKIWKRGQYAGVGVDTPDHSATGLNTDPEAVGTINTLAIVTGSGMGAIVAEGQVLDDFAAWNESGGQPNDLRGDLRCIVLRPDADTAQKDFTRVGGDGFVPTYSGSEQPALGSANITAGVVYFWPLQAAGASGTLDHLTFVPAVTDAGAKTKMALYADTNGLDGIPAAPIATCNAEVTGLSGATEYDFTGQGIQVQAGVRYWVALICDRAITGIFFPVLNWAAGDLVVNPSHKPGVVGSTYPNFPSNGSGITLVWAGLTMGWAGVSAVLAPPAANFNCVWDAQQDGSESYVKSATPGAIDLYGFADLADPPFLTVMVVPKMFMWKTEAGTRQAEVELVSGATTHDSGAVDPTTTPGYISDPLTEDPNTPGIAWSFSAINAITAGPKVAA
jgi:hypothetical protein